MIEPGSLNTFVEAAESVQAGIVYSDFYDEGNQGKILHPLIDYQPGSVRDDFGFGALVLFSVPATREAVENYGAIPCVQYAGLYALRLKVSIDHPVYHFRKPLYSVVRPALDADESSGRRKDVCVRPSPE